MALVTSKIPSESSFISGHLLPPPLFWFYLSPFLPLLRRLWVFCFPDLPNLFIQFHLQVEGSLFCRIKINSCGKGKFCCKSCSKTFPCRRIDFYSGKKDPSLPGKLEEKIQKIRDSNPRPPQKRPESGAKPKKKRRK